MSINVSVITPFYKGNKYMTALYNSLCDNLSFAKSVNPDFEIEWIIVNDSPEEKVEIPKSKSDLKVSVYNHAKNCGIHQARVTGLINSRGEFVIFLDQDDQLAKECIIDTCLHIDDSDVLIENAYLEDENGELRLLYPTKGTVINALSIAPYIGSHNQIVSPGHCLVRKKSIPVEWKTKILGLNGSDDLYLWMLMFGYKKKFSFLNKAYYTHKFTGSNLSDDGEKMGRSSLDFVDFLKETGRFSDYQLDCFIRSRNLHSLRGYDSIIQFISEMFSNYDIILMRVFWKLRAKLIK